MAPIIQVDNFVLELFKEKLKFNLLNKNFEYCKLYGNCNFICSKLTQYGCIISSNCKREQPIQTITLQTMQVNFFFKYNSL